MYIKTQAKTLKVMLTDEIDHHSAGNLRLRIDNELIINTPETLVLDFSGVTFMDSSAVGLVLGRYKKSRKIRHKNSGGRTEAP